MMGIKTYTAVIWLVLSVTAFPLLSSAQDDLDDRKTRRHVLLQGILGSKVILAIDGKRHMLTIGQGPIEGVQVLSIGDDGAEVEVDGKQRTLRLGSHEAVTAPFKQKESVMVSIARGPRGMYTTIGSINGLPVKFLVDTGATTIAMNSSHARRLAVNYRLEGQEATVATASGMTTAYRVRLDKVSVGEITLRNVSAVVMDGEFPLDILLGMSFLGQLEIRRDGGVMHLRQKF